MVPIDLSQVSAIRYTEPVLSTINQVINQGKGTFDLVNQSRLDVGQSIKANLLKALTSLDLGHVTANLA